MTYRRDMLMIRIVMNKDYNLIDVAVNLKINRFINCCLFIKKTLSSVLSVFYLDMWDIINNVETLKLIVIYSDVIISVDTAVILNAIKSWSVDFNNSVDWVKKFKMSFVARFNVDNDIIMFTKFSVDNDIITMNEVRFNFNDNAVLINKVILMF